MMPNKPEQRAAEAPKLVAKAPQQSTKSAAAGVATSPATAAVVATRPDVSKLRIVRERIMIPTKPVRGKSAPSHMVARATAALNSLCHHLCHHGANDRTYTNVQCAVALWECGSVATFWRRPRPN